MSLINNMLKDLESREKTSHYHPAITTAYVQKRLPDNSQYFLASTLLTLFVALLVILFGSKQKPVLLSPILSHHQIQHPIALKPTNENEQWIKTVSISGLSLQEKDNITELSFMTSHPALYRIISNDSANILTIIFDDAKLEASVPDLSNTGISKIVSKQIPNGIRFDISLANQASIKNIDISKDLKHPEIIIDVEHPQANTLPATATQASHITTTSKDVFKLPAMQSIYNEQYQKALGYAERGDYSGAIKHLSGIIDAQPAYQDARVSLAALLIDQGQSTKAANVINEGLKLNPDAVPLVELKARLLTAKGDIKRAIQLLQTQSPSMTDNPEYHAFMAALYQKDNSDLLAIRLYKRLLSDNPQNGNWWFGLGLSLEKLGEINSAYDAYVKAVTTGNVNTESYSMLQDHLQSLKETLNEG